MQGISECTWSHLKTTLMQVAWFFATMWFLYRVEREHRLKFLKRHGIEPETCGFSQATRFDFSFVVCHLPLLTYTTIYACLGSLFLPDQCTAGHRLVSSMPSSRVRLVATVIVRFRHYRFVLCCQFLNMMTVTTSFAVTIADCERASRHSGDES